MKDSALFKQRVIIAISSILLITVYLYMFTPMLTDNIEKLGMDNKLIERDIKELDDLGGDMDSVESSIEETQNKLSDIRQKAEINNETYDEDISEKAEDAGVDIKEMDQSELKIIGDKQKAGNTLYSQPVMITFNGTFKNGVKLFEALENSEEGIYIIDDYLFKRDSKKEKNSEWIINLQVYYYN